MSITKMYQKAKTSIGYLIYDLFVDGGWWMLFAIVFEMLIAVAAITWLSLIIGGMNP